MRHAVIGLALLCALVTNCTRPGKERAERDLRVGKATNGDLSVNVTDGLAAIRALDVDRLGLWSSAPAWELELASGSGGGVRLEVQNCINDVQLTALGPDASATPVATDRVTRKRWDLELPPGSSRFRLAPPDLDDRSTFRFALLSDVQEAIDRVQDIFDAVNQERELRFLLGAGDLTEGGSVAELARFQR